MFSKNYSVPQSTACFSCSGSELSSYLKSGYFRNFLNSKLSVCSGCTIKLFDNVSTFSSVLTNSQYLFMKIKMSFSKVKSFATGSIDNSKIESNLSDIEVLRMDIVKVFHILISDIQKINSRYFDSTSLLNNIPNEDYLLKRKVMQLIKEVKNLLIHVGRISSISGINNAKDFSNDLSKSAQNYNCYYHLCLDIWYNCIALLYVIHILIPTSLDEVFCDFIDEPSPFLQLASFVVYELSSLAINNYKSDNMCNNSPFFCACIKEFWIMLIKLIDRSSSHFERSSFWNIFLTGLQIIFKNVSSVSSNGELSVDTFCVASLNMHMQNPIEACLWLASHIAPLYKYDTLGYFCDYETAKSGYIVGKYLVNHFINIPEIGEKVLRNSLSFCIQLVKLWEPNGDILLPLTDFYFKKINGTFNVQGIDLSYLFKDSSSWFIYITNLSNLVSLGKETSFDHFLCILNLQLKCDDDNSLWRTLKGRIYTKLPKALKNISEVGLQNIFSLFHIIVISGQLEVVDKICEIASSFEADENHFRNRIISWKALFVLLYIYQEKNHNAEKIIACISKLFNLVCDKYSKTDSMKKNKLLNLLLVYIDNMNELFKRNNSCNFSVYQLITSGFSDILNDCSASEGNYILSVLHSVLQRIQKVAESDKAGCVRNETEYIRILQLIFNNIYPFVEKVAVIETAPLVVSDIAATLTKLTSDFTSLINNSPFDFHKIFTYFASKETVCTHIICRYLCLILDCPSLVDDIRIKIADLDVLIFQSWLRCIICVQTKKDYLQEFTRKVLQQPVIIELFPDLQFLRFDNEDHVHLAIKFFHLMGNPFTKLCPQSKTSMAQRVQQFFKNYASFAVYKIKKEKDGPTLSHIYKLTSYLVEHCAPILHYHVTSEHVLLQLLDQTIYPQLLFPRDMTLQYLASSSVKEYLPRFMRGLFKLDYRKDKSIEREVRNICIYYISMLPITGNPLVKLLVDSVSKKPDGLSPDSYIFVLEALKFSLVSNNAEKPMNIFEFYLEVFKQVLPAYKKEITNILLTCAMEIYMKQNDSLAQYVKTLIEKVLIYFKDKMSLPHSKIILIPITEWFIKEKLQWSIARGFSVLYLYADYVPQAMSDIVPFLTKSVETIEKNRGSGEDLLLRTGLRDFVAKIENKLHEYRYFMD